MPTFTNPAVTMSSNRWLKTAGLSPGGAAARNAKQKSKKTPTPPPAVCPLNNRKPPAAASSATNPPTKKLNSPKHINKVAVSPAKPLKVASQRRGTRVRSFFCHARRGKKNSKDLFLPSPLREELINNVVFCPAKAGQNTT